MKAATYLISIACRPFNFCYPRQLFLLKMPNFIQALSNLNRSSARYLKMQWRAYSVPVQRDTLFPANPALATMLGYRSPGEFLDAIEDIGNQCFTDQHDLKRFRSILSARNQVLNFETRWLRRKGPPIYVSVSARRILNDQGELIYYEGSLTDVTERRAKEQAERAQKSAQLAREKAEAASQAKSQFLATMSHEIRTPMNGVLGMAQLLKQGQLTTEQKEQVETIYQSGQSLLSILNDVLDFTKVEAGQLELEQLPFSLFSLMNEIQAILKPLVVEKNLKLNVEIDPTLDISLLGDRRSLSQILMNLCTNAVKFTEQGKITLGVSKRETKGHKVSLRFEVQDMGIGIPESAKGRIFQHFSQADSSITRRYGGTGLGLSICKKLVDLHQGSIGFDSEIGRGSLFWFQIDYPLASQESINYASTLESSPPLDRHFFRALNIRAH